MLGPAEKPIARIALAAAELAVDTSSAAEPDLPKTVRREDEASPEPPTAPLPMPLPPPRCAPSGALMLPEPKP